MRKLKLLMQISVDGFVAGPNGEMDWMTVNWDDDIRKYVDDLTDSIDTILLGRKMTAGFIQYWTSVAANPNDERQSFGKIMTGTHKVVFTKTLTKSEWANTDIATGDITDEVNKLKNQEGKDIIVYGGAGFVSSLIKAGLIDEFHLSVNPCAIGNGMTIFKELERKQKFTLIKSTPFECGKIALCYQPKRD